MKCGVQSEEVISSELCRKHQAKPAISFLCNHTPTDLRGLIKSPRQNPLTKSPYDQMQKNQSQMDRHNVRLVKSF